MNMFANGLHGEGVSRKEISGFLTGLKYNAGNSKDKNCAAAQALLEAETFKQWQCLMSECVAFFAGMFCFAGFPPARSAMPWTARASTGIATYMKEGGIKTSSQKAGRHASVQIFVKMGMRRHTCRSVMICFRQQVCCSHSHNPRQTNACECQTELRNVCECQEF